MHAVVKFSKILFEVLAVCLPRPSVNADRRTSLEREVRPSEQIGIEMVEQCRRTSLWSVPYELP
jgi:hypothetical protein